MPNLAFTQILSETSQQPIQMNGFLSKYFVFFPIYTNFIRIMENQEEYTPKWTNNLIEIAKNIHKKPNPIYQKYSKRPKYEYEKKEHQTPNTIFKTPLSSHLQVLNVK